MKQVPEPNFDIEASGDESMDALFDSIGFEINQADDYYSLLEYTDRIGTQSSIGRGNATLQGYCWKVGEGLEVWSWLCSSEGKVFYEDCRPAFRSRYSHVLEPWELIEYEESGDAILRGFVQDGSEVIFQLQNLTELNPQTFHYSHLHVAFAGLAYSAYARSGAYLKRAPTMFELVEEPDFTDDDYESDYLIRGRVLAWRYMKNPVTENDVVWVYLDVGKLRLEVILNRNDLRGRLKIGAALSAKVWLQGHILAEGDLEARYEGVDPGYEVGDFWYALRRGN
jgi:hypothetical protein